MRSAFTVYQMPGLSWCVTPCSTCPDSAQQCGMGVSSYVLLNSCCVQVRPPMVPTHVFLIDVSHTAVHSGAAAAACAAITSILDDLQGMTTLMRARTPYNLPAESGRPWSCHLLHVTTSELSIRPQSGKRCEQGTLKIIGWCPLGAIGVWYGPSAYELHYRH